MALITMCCHDTIENQRTRYTEKTLTSLIETVDLDKHRLIIIDNDSCKETKKVIQDFASYEGNIEIITNKENIGTAEAINLAWRERKKDENCIKIDNDVVINYIQDFIGRGWVEEMEEAIAREPKIGQIGLKRKDLMESPTQPNIHFRSQLYMLPHEPGQRWIIVEKANHIMGTCVMHSSALLDKVGYLFQLGLYGFDDSFMSFRSKKAGFINCFLPHIEIEHIDAGGDEYCKWKTDHSSLYWKDYEETIKDYDSGKKNIYYNPFK